MAMQALHSPSLNRKTKKEVQREPAGAAGLDAWEQTSPLTRPWPMRGGGRSWRRSPSLCPETLVRVVPVHPPAGFSTQPGVSVKQQRVPQPFWGHGMQPTKALQDVRTRATSLLPPTVLRGPRTICTQLGNVGLLTGWFRWSTGRWLCF